MPSTLLKHSMPSIRSGLQATLLLVGAAAMLPAPSPVSAGQDASNASRGVDPLGTAARRQVLDPSPILRSETFRNLVKESYLAESDIEPTLDRGESREFNRILDLLGSEDPEDVAEARRRLEDARAGDGNAVFDFTLAQILFENDEIEAARTAYAAAVAKFPKFRRAWRAIGAIDMQAERFDQAIPSLVKVIELGGGESITYGFLGFAFANVGDDLAAEHAFRMAVMLDSTNLDWRMQLARTLFNQKRYADAAALCDKLIADDPTRGDLWLLQANAHLGQERTMRAAENYEMVDRLGQSTADSLSMLGDIYVNADLPELAAGAYRRSFAMDPPPAPDRAIRAANVMVLRGGYEAAGPLVAALRERFADSMSDQQTKDLLKLQARLASAAGEGGAAEALEEIVALDPLDGEALILLGQEYRRSGDPIKAAFAFERAAAMERFEAKAKRLHGQLLVSTGDYAAALPLLRRSQSLEPNENLRSFIDQVERVSRASAAR
ncbi:MAG: tetratricopeptide repeat protein [Planctomycetota bacterium]